MLPECGFTVLGKFYPSKLDATTIAVELRIWLLKLRIDPNVAQIAVREPIDHINLSTTDRVITQWHRDGLGKYALDLHKVPTLKWMILWTNGTPTELQCAGNVVHSEPYDVVIIDNHVVWHRCPPCEVNRYFVRILAPIVPKAMV